MTQKEKPNGYLDSIAIPGNRVGVLLIHSLGSSPMELRPMANALARSGCTVHCPMLPGLADGTDIASMSAWTDWYALVETAHDTLRQKCDVVIVGGLSIGTLLALRLAARRPDDVHGLMLFAPIEWPNGWAVPWYFNFFRLVHQKWCARLFRFTLNPPYGIKDERIRRFVIDSFTSDGRSVEDAFGRSGGVVLEFRRLAAEVNRTLGTIRQPTAIFHPRFDDQSKLSVTAKLQRKLGGLVETYVLDDSYHRVTLDRQRSFVEDRAVDFAGRITRQVDAQVALARMVKASAQASAASE